MNTIAQYEEGGTCPDCGTGKLEYPRVRGCSCHISPPCSACVDQRLKCDDCGCEEPEPEPPPPPTQKQIDDWAKWRADMEAAKQRGHILPSGGRIFNVDYDSSSGSTMVFSGRYEGPVTAAEIYAHMGDGTFGHRGPTLFPDRDWLNGPEKQSGRFTYTKITD